MGRTSVDLAIKVNIGNYAVERGVLCVGVVLGTYESLGAFIYQTDIFPTSEGWGWIYMALSQTPCIANSCH